MNITDVASLRARLWEAGFRPVPVYTVEAGKRLGHGKPGKHPFGDKWQIRARAEPPEAVTLKPRPDTLNTGLLCDGYRAIDFDIDDPALAAKCFDIACSMFGEAPIRFRENSPRKLMLLRAAVGEPSKRWITGTLGKIEVLGRGQQFVAFGDHESGASLKWVGGEPGEAIATNIPATTEDQIGEFLDQCAIIIQAAPEKRANGADHMAPPSENAHQEKPELLDKRYRGYIKKLLANVSGASDGAVHDVLRNQARAFGGILHAAGISESSAKSMLVNARQYATERDRLNAGETADAGLKHGIDHPYGLPNRARTNGKHYGHAHAADDPPAADCEPVEEPDEPPTINVLAGFRHQAADAGLVALDSARVPFYVRAHALVRVCRAAGRASDGGVTKIPAVLPVTLAALSRALGCSAVWQRFNKDGDAVRIDPPKELVEQIAGMVDEWPFSPLLGVISTPTMRPDGSLLTKPGYDPATGYVLFDPPPMKPIPENPSKPDALEALDILDDLLAEFPFAGETEDNKQSASRSVSLSMLMTTVLRGAFPAVPMHVVTSPEAGTGKSYLQDIASTIATGDRCAVISKSADDAETEKALKGAALAQFPVIAIDNVSNLLFGDFLCQLTERPMLQVRPLGTSDVKRIANSFCVFANGNNLRIAADSVRRTVMCSLDANREDPENRVFSKQPVAMVLKDRGKYVAAILTIARAYIVAGRPKKLGPYMSYDAWSDTVRSALVWLGRPDPIATVDDIKADDPIRQQRAAVFGAWAGSSKLIVGVGYTTGELVKAANSFSYANPSAPPEREDPGLWEAFYLVAAAKSGPTQQIDGTRLGQWLGRNNGNIAAGHRLTVDRSDKARPSWKVEPVKTGQA